MQMDITKLSLEKLESMCYQQIESAKQIEQNIVALQQAIHNRREQATAEAPPNIIPANTLPPAPANKK